MLDNNNVIIILPLIITFLQYIKVTTFLSTSITLPHFSRLVCQYSLLLWQFYLERLHTSFPQTSFHRVAGKGIAECELFSQVTCLDSFAAENW